MNNKLMNVTKVFAKISEIIAWLGTGLSVFGGIASLFMKNMILTSEGLAQIVDANVSIPGTTVSDLLSQTSSAKYYILTILLTILLATNFSLLAMIFRNIVRIFESTTPFATENVIRIREIGIFAISIPFVSFFGELVSNMFLPSPIADVDLKLSHFMFGLIILCLSQYFQYGASLEKDVDGLL